MCGVAEELSKALTGSFDRLFVEKQREYFLISSYTMFILLFNCCLMFYFIEYVNLLLNTSQIYQDILDLIISKMISCD